MADGVEHIYLACGHTDFRRQIDGLSAMVSLKFNLDPYLSSAVFIFCNKKKDTLKLLRWNENGFILATKKVMQVRASTYGVVITFLLDQKIDSEELKDRLIKLIGIL